MAYRLIELLEEATLMSNGESSARRFGAREGSASVFFHFKYGFQMTVFECLGVHVAVLPFATEGHRPFDVAVFF